MYSIRIKKSINNEAVKMVKYKIFEHIVISDGLPCVTYGIKAEQKIDGYWQTVARVYDVTLNREEILSLCKKCNKNKLSPSHLKDVCEDFLCRIYS